MSESVKFKDSHVGRIPKGWGVVLGSKILRLGSGVSPSEVVFTNDGEIMFMKVNDFNHPDNSNGITATNLSFMEVENANVPLYDKGTIVIAKRGAAIFKNRVQLLAKRSSVDTNLMTINIGSGFSEIFFKNLLEFVNLESIADTTSIPQINNFHLYDMSFIYPPLPEQQKIASILTSMDEVLEKTQAQINKLKDLKKAMMQELLTKGIGHTEFKDSPVGRIPKSWEYLSAQELLDSKVLLALKDGNHGSQYPRVNDFTKQGTYFLAASSITEVGEIDFNSCPCLPDDKAAKLRIKPAKGGDVILTHNATVGRVGLIPNHIKKIIVSTSTTYYRVNPKIISSGFLKFYFQSPVYQEQLKTIMGQTTRNQVPITAQKELLIPLIPTDEQKQIFNLLNSIERTLESHQLKHSKTKSLKKALMQDLLTGRVRVKV